MGIVIIESSTEFTSIYTYNYRLFIASLRSMLRSIILFISVLLLFPINLLILLDPIKI